MLFYFISSVIFLCCLLDWKALKKIWGSDTYFNGRSMDVYIAKLRKYLKDDDKLEIVNIHGNGFRLVETV